MISKHIYSETAMGIYSFNIRARLRSLRTGGDHVLFHLLDVSLELGPPVLEPRDHLSTREAELPRNLVPVRRRQIFLKNKTFFQFVDLLICKGCPRFSFLLGQLVLRLLLLFSLLSLLWKRRLKFNKLWNDVI